MEGKQELEGMHGIMCHMHLIVHLFHHAVIHIIIKRVTKFNLRRQIFLNLPVRACSQAPWLEYSLYAECVSDFHYAHIKNILPVA